MPVNRIHIIDITRPKRYSQTRYNMRAMGLSRFIRRYTPKQQDGTVVAGAAIGIALFAIFAASYAFEDGHAIRYVLTTTNDITSATEKQTGDIIEAKYERDTTTTSGLTWVNLGLAVAASIVVVSYPSTLDNGVRSVLVAMMLVYAGLTTFDRMTAHVLVGILGAAACALAVVRWLELYTAKRAADDDNDDDDDDDVAFGEKTRLTSKQQKDTMSSILSGL